MKDILFIQCPYNKRPGIDRVYPLGIGYLIEAVRQSQQSYDFFDGALITPDKKEDYLTCICDFLKNLLCRESYTVIAICVVTTGSILSLNKIIKTCKSYAPNAKLIMGGPLPSIEETCRVFFEHYDIDAIIRGEGEDVIPLLIAHVRSGHSLDSFQYATLKNRMGPYNFVSDINRIPFPYRDHQYMEQYSVSLKRALFSQKRSASIITSRGCPCACFYCVSGNLRNKKFTKRAWSNIAEEVSLLLHEYDVDNIIFYDDCFFPNKLKVNQDIATFLNELSIRNCTNFIWQMEIRADVICHTTEESLKNLYLHGCRQINLGIETPDPAFLHYLGKTTKIEDAVEACQKIHQTVPDMIIGGTFIVGGPHVCKEQVKQTQQFASSLGLHFVNFFPLELHPGTPLYQDIYGDSDEWYRTIVEHKNNSQCLLYENPDFPEEELKSAVAKAYEDFYSPAWEAEMKKRLGDSYDQIRVNLFKRQTQIKLNPANLKII